MVALSKKVEVRDSLDAISSRQREINLTVNTPDLLRKPNHRKQRARMRERRKDAVDQLVQQMTSKDRRMFRNPVSVDIHIDAASEYQPPSFWRVAKEYVDLLKKVVIPDDAFIDHLTLTFQFSDRDGTSTSYRVVPSSRFVADYDRAFRVTADLESYDDPRLRSTTRFDEHDRSYLRGHESVVHLIDELDAEEQAQLDEDPDCWVDLQIPSGYEGFEDADTRASIRRDYAAICRRERGRWFTDHGFDIRDRPGGEPHWFGDLEQIGDAEIVSLDLNAPGIIELRTPPKTDRQGRPLSLPNQAGSAWHATVKEDSGWWGMSFPDSLILDIGLVGNAASRNDIDNVAYKVIEGFEDYFSSSNPNVIGFRTYRRNGDTSCIRAKAMPAGRLFHLQALIEEARNRARDARPQREKALPF